LSRGDAEEVEGEEEKGDDDEAEEDGDGEREDDEGSGDGDDDEGGGGEDEDEADEAGPMETERTLVLPLIVMGTLTWMGTGGVTLLLRFGGGARICWRRVTARRSPRCS
jgi:hypothetical protein